MATDDVPSTGQASSTGFSKTSLRENATWLIALLGSLAAAVVPATEAVRGYYELKLKDQEFNHELKLKQDDLQSRVELQFLTLVTTQSMKPQDKKRILDVLANYGSEGTSLQLWAKNEIRVLSLDIESLRKLEDERLKAGSEKDLQLRDWLYKSIECEELEYNLDKASSEYDRDTVLHLGKDEIPACQQDAKNKEAALSIKRSSTPALPTTSIVPPLKPGETLESKITAELVAKMLPQAPTGAIKANLPSILKSLGEFGVGDPEMALVALSTIAAETAGFMPIAEGQSRFNTSPGGQQFDLYDNRKDFGNQGPPDGARYKGRGYVQLTGRANYMRVGQALGVDLENDPDRESDPIIAARTLAWSIKAKEQALRSAIRADDLSAVRRLTNGNSHGLPAFNSAFKTGRDALS
jgi:putative chitinase